MSDFARFAFLSNCYTRRRAHLWPGRYTRPFRNTHTHIQKALSFSSFYISTYFVYHTLTQTTSSFGTSFCESFCFSSPSPNPPHTFIGNIPPAAHPPSLPPFLFILYPSSWCKSPRFSSASDENTFTSQQSCGLTPHRRRDTKSNQRQHIARHCLPPKNGYVEPHIAELLTKGRGGGIDFIKALFSTIIGI